MIILGNPTLGTPLMQSQQSAALDLPLRVAVWQTADGKVQIGYWPPSLVAQRHGIADAEDSIAKMTNALDAITDAASGQ